MRLRVIFNMPQGDDPLMATISLHYFCLMRMILLEQERESMTLDIDCVFCRYTIILH